MGSLFSPFSSAYRFASRYRMILYAATLAIVAVSFLVLTNIRIDEDIQALLPDGKAKAAKDFRLLQKSPFARKVLINLKADPSTDTHELLEAADRLAVGMSMPFFSRVVSGPNLPSGGEMFSWTMKSLPSLFTEQDVATTTSELTDAKVGTRLSNIRNQLSTADGWFMKPLFQSDPLELRNIALKKFRYLNMISDVKIETNHFVSADGKNTLLIAETPVKMTDSEGSKNLIDYFNGLVGRMVPPGIEVSLIGGHVYTSTNAEMIKRDLFVVLGCSSMVIFMMILGFLRSWKGIFVFLVPVSVVTIATAGTILIYDTVSALTIAFGSVLLGISDDYPILVYLALSKKERDPSVVLPEVARPALFGGLTTIATFSVLLLSDLPGQRQLAVFSIIGVVASLVFSLLVLPHLIRALPGKYHSIGAYADPKFTFGRKQVIAAWLITMLVCAWQAGRLHFNGDIQSLNLVPEKIRRIEHDFARTWGTFRGNALLFAEGRDLEASLKTNDRLFTYLTTRLPDQKIVSIAPVFPSEATQRMNRERWTTYWSGGGRKVAEDLLAREGVKNGFTAAAFKPFIDYLSREPASDVLESLRTIGLGELVGAMIIQEDNAVQTITLVPDTPELLKRFEARENPPEGVHLVSQGRLRSMISEALIDNFVRYTGIAFFVIVVFLGILFRDIKKVLCALVPVISGLAFMSGIMGFFGMEFNLFNIIAAILVIGLGADLGIFMVCKISEGYDHTTNLAVLLGGSTSLIGFGALVLARHPSLNSVGITVLLGMCGVIPSALLVIPALYRRKGGLSPDRNHS